MSIRGQFYFLFFYMLPSLSLAVTPKQWENISDINIAKAEQQKINSLSLQALVESVLGQTAADMKKQVQATTSAFQLNIQEIKSAKSQMEDQLAKVGQMSIRCKRMDIPLYFILNLFSSRFC